MLISILFTNKIYNKSILFVFLAEHCHKLIHYYHYAIKFYPYDWNLSKQAGKGVNFLISPFLKNILYGHPDTGST